MFTVSASRALQIVFAVFLGFILLVDFAVAAPPVVGKRLRPRDRGVLASGGNSTIDSILSSTPRTDIYDPLVLHSTRRLEERIMPRGDINNFDDSLANRAAQKVFVVQGTREMLSTLQRSEFRELYYGGRDLFNAFRNTFRYSLQSDGGGYSVSRESSGEKLIEFNVELDMKQGFDPQLRFGEGFRVRYDYIRGQPLLEFGVEF